MYIAGLFKALLHLSVIPDDMSEMSSKLDFCFLFLPDTCHVLVDPPSQKGPEVRRGRIRLCWNYMTA
jgi:hypothetical protein